MRALWLLLLLALAGCGTAPVALPPSGQTLAPVGTVARAGRSGPSATVNSLPVVLNAGWNPVGFQAQRLTALAGTGLVAGQASWNGTAYVTGNLDTSLSGRLGYWLFAREATTFTYSGADDGSGAYVDLPLTGYNLVSFCTNLEIPTSSLVATRNGAVVPLNSVVLTQFFELQTNNTYATVEVPGGVIKPGRPYWIFAREPVRLTWAGAPSPSPSPAASPAASAPPAASPAASPSPAPGASPSPGASPVATRLLFTSVPQATAGVAANYGVQVQDQYGHPVSGVTVSLALNTSPPGATLTSSGSSSGTVPATFTKAGSNYTLRASAAGVPDALSAPFTVAAAAPARLGWAGQPAGGISLDFLYPVTVGLFDPFDNPAPHPGPGALTVTVTGSPGVLGPNALTIPSGGSSVTFPGLLPATAGSYSLTASASGYSSVTGNAFTIAADSGLRVQPFNFSGRGVAGQTVPLVVGFFDSSGNPLPGQSGTITVSGPGLATQSVAAVNGFATFNLQPTRAGTVTLALSSAGVPTTQQAFIVSPGPVASLVFSTQPVTMSSASTGSVAVTALDAHGNVKTDASAAVRFQLGSGFGPFGPAFGAFSSGVASASFRLPAAQAGATLQAVYLGPESVPPVTSAPFDINLETAQGTLGVPGFITDAFLSGSARYVTWYSNVDGQIYVRDRLTDAATIASLQDGTTTVPAAGSGQSQPVVSDDGDTVVFVSSASNLVPGYSGSGAQVYLRRRSTNRTILVSRSAASATAGGNGESVFPRVSADGSKVAFESEATNLLASLSGRQIVLATVGPTGVTAMTQRSGNADQPCRLGGMTSDGSAVIFRTAATNLGGPALGPAANARLFVSDAGGLRFVAQTDSFSSLFAEAALSDAGNAFWGAGVDPQTGVAESGGQGLYRLAGGSYARLAAAQVLSLGVDRTGARACYFDLGSFTVPTVDLVTGAVTGTLPGGDSASSFQPCSLAAGGGLGGYFSSSGLLLSPLP